MVKLFVIKFFANSKTFFVVLQQLGLENSNKTSEFLSRILEDPSSLIMEWYS